MTDHAKAYYYAGILEGLAESLRDHDSNASVRLTEIAYWLKNRADSELAPTTSALAKMDQLIE